MQYTYATVYVYIQLDPSPFNEQVCAWLPEESPGESGEGAGGGGGGEGRAGQGQRQQAEQRAGEGGPLAQRVGKSCTHLKLTIRRNIQLGKSRKNSETISVHK